MKKEAKKVQISNKIKNKSLKAKEPTPAPKKLSNWVYLLALFFGFLAYVGTVQGLKEFSTSFLTISVISLAILFILLPILANLYFSYVLKKNPHTFGVIGKMFNLNNYKKVYQSSWRAWLNVLSVILIVWFLVILLNFGFLSLGLDSAWFLGCILLWFLIPPLLFTIILDLTGKDGINLGSKKLTRAGFFAGWFFIALMALFIFNRLRTFHFF